MTAALLALLAAHESSVSSSRLEFDGAEIRATFTFALEDLAGLARLDLNRDGTVDPDEWRRVLPGIFAYVGEKFRIEHCASEGDLGQVPPAVGAGEGRTPVTLALRYRPARPGQATTIRCDLFSEHGGNPRHVAELPGGRMVVFDKDRLQVDGLTASPPRQYLLPLGVAALALTVAAVLLRALLQS